MWLPPHNSPSPFWMNLMSLSGQKLNEFATFHMFEVSVANLIQQAMREWMPNNGVKWVRQRALKWHWTRVSGLMSCVTCAVVERWVEAVVQRYVGDRWEMAWWTGTRNKLILVNLCYISWVRIHCEMFVERIRRCVSECWVDDETFVHLWIFDGLSAVFG